MLARDQYSLSKLLQPITQEQFFSQYWEVQPLVVNRQAPTYYSDLFDIRDIDSLISLISTKSTSLTNANNPLESVRISGDARSFDTIKAYQLFTSGATFIIRDVQNATENFSLLCRFIEQDFSAPSKINLYVTPPDSKGFAPHYDTHDVILLQLFGSKEWRIFDRPVEFPLSGQVFDPRIHAVGAPSLSARLEQGDLLYIPRGFIHEGACGNEGSLHATIGITALHWSNVVLEAISQLCLDDSLFRHALPPGLSHKDYDHDGAAAIIESLSVRIKKSLNLADALKTVRENFIASRAPILTGQLQQILGTPISLNDTFCARTTNLWFRRVTNGEVAIVAHGRQLNLSQDLLPAAEFALTHHNFVGKSLPGHVSIESKLELLKLLISEALIFKSPRSSDVV